MNIEGKSAIVTGGGSGLGAGTARALAARGAGALRVRFVCFKPNRPRLLQANQKMPEHPALASK